MKNKFKSFTLAEVLITLTIIGVIAAITIPNLMQKYQEHVTVNKVKKFYSTLTNAYAQAVKENEEVDEWNIHGASAQNAEKIYELLFKPYLKIIKNCGVNSNGCVLNYGDYKYRNGNSYPLLNLQGTNSLYSFVLSDSSIVWFRPLRNDETWGEISIIYDVNGKKGPNTLGIDVFLFAAYSRKLQPYGLGNLFATNCAKHDSNGDQCTAWLLYKGNMDYLHCDDLTWNGKNKCSK